MAKCSGGGGGDSKNWDAPRILPGNRFMYIGSLVVIVVIANPHTALEVKVILKKFEVVFWFMFGVRKMHFFSGKKINSKSTNTILWRLKPQDSFAEFNMCVKKVVLIFRKCKV